MIVGHYGPAFLGRALAPTVPLWVLVLATQVVDVFWAIFVLAGIEKLRLVEGITATNPLDLYYMPYTHSLVGASAWAVGAAVAWRAMGRGPRPGRAAVVVGAAVFSHWLLDLLVHRPDLPLYDDVHKVGLGLWDHRVLAFLLEVGLLLGGLLLYLRRTRPVRPAGRFGMPAFGAVLVGLQAFVVFGASPDTPAGTAGALLAGIGVVTGAAAWLERGRRLPAQ